MDDEELLVEGVDDAEDEPEVLDDEDFSVVVPPDVPAPLSDGDDGVFAVLLAESDPRESVR